MADFAGDRDRCRCRGGGRAHHEYFKRIGKTTPDRVVSIEEGAEEMALKHTGLRLRHPDWRDLVTAWKVSTYDDLTCVARTTVNVSVEDPGIYDLSLGGRTSGTRYSRGQMFGFRGDSGVCFLGKTLVK